MKNCFEKIKNCKIFNKGFLKKIKDFIFYKILSPYNEAKTDKYRTEIGNKIYKIFQGKTWGLIAGSFLRFYRDHTMKGQDLDYMILRKDFMNIKEKLIKNGFLIKQIFFDKDENLTEIKYLYKGVEIDVFLIDKIKNNYYLKCTYEKDNNTILEKKVVENEIFITSKDYISFQKKIINFDKIKEYEYKGMKFFAPMNAEEHIICCYGEGWKIYDPNFDPRTNPKNNMPIPIPNASSIVFIKPVKSYKNVL